MPEQIASTSPAPERAHQFLAGPGERGLVSVIIPTFNREKLIRTAIDSVLAQTYRPIEIIVVDDGSTDNTRAVVESYGEPVRYVYQTNHGVATARNTGLRVANGEFLALLDSDDVWFPWKIEAQVRVLDRYPAVGMVWTDMTATDEDGAILSPRYLRTFYSAHAAARIDEVCERDDTLSRAWKDAPAEVAGAAVWRGDIFSRILLGNLVHTSTLLVRRTRAHRAGEIDVEFTPLGEDYEWHIRICLHGDVALIDESSMLYRVGAADQLTAPHLGIHLARSNLKTVLRWLERGGPRVSLPRRTIHDRLAQAYGWVGEAEMHFGIWHRARPHLWQSLLHRPGQKKAVMLLVFSMMPMLVFRGALRLKRQLRSMRSVPAAVVVAHLALLEWLDPFFNIVCDLPLESVLPV